MSAGTLARLAEPPCKLEYIRLRCREVDGCWVWAMAAKNGKWPIVTFRRVGVDGVKRDFILYTRHVVYWIKNGERPDFTGGRTLRTTCGNPMCVNPAHAVMQTFSDVQREMTHQRRPEVRERIAMTKRANSKLSDAEVKDIKGSDLPRKKLAEKYGISTEYVRQLQIGEWRREYRGNPFVGLGA